MLETVAEGSEEGRSIEGSGIVRGMDGDREVLLFTESIGTSRLGVSELKLVSSGSH